MPEGTGFTEGLVSQSPATEWFVPGVVPVLANAGPEALHAVDQGRS
jgi:hypothetical protein